MSLRITRVPKLGWLAGLAFAVLGGQAHAQSTTPPGIIAGGRPSENVSAGAVGARAPGRLVSAGTARAQNRLNGFFVPPEITQTAAPNPQTEFLLDAIPVLFQELNRAIFTLASAILARDGIELPALSSQFGSLTPGSGQAPLVGRLREQAMTRLSTTATKQTVPLGQR